MIGTAPRLEQKNHGKVRLIVLTPTLKNLTFQTLW